MKYYKDVGGLYFRTDGKSWWRYYTRNDARWTIDTGDKWVEITFVSTTKMLTDWVNRKKYPAIEIPEEDVMLEML